MRRLAEEEDEVKLRHLQGRAQQLRILEAQPFEVQGLLAEFQEADKRAEAIRAAEEKRKQEVR